MQVAHCSDNASTFQVHELFLPSIIKALTWPFPEEPLTGRSSLRRAEPSALVVLLGRGPYLRGKGPASYAEAEAKAGSPLLPQAPLQMGALEARQSCAQRTTTFASSGNYFMRFPVVFPFPCGPTVYSPVDHSDTFHSAIRSYLRDSSTKLFR